MRITLAAVLTVVLAACAVPGSTVRSGSGLAGTYVVNGVDPVGVEYSGTVIIGRASDPGTYTVEWIVTGAILEGVGTHSGDRFVVDWSTVSGPRDGARGIAEYLVEDDGRLVGTRTIDGVDGLGTEEIFPET